MSCRGLEMQVRSTVKLPGSVAIVRQLDMRIGGEPVVAGTDASRYEGAGEITGGDSSGLEVARTENRSDRRLSGVLNAYLGDLGDRTSSECLPATTRYKSINPAVSSTKRTEISVSL
jgi:hypothetical protein